MRFTFEGPDPPPWLVVVIVTLVLATGTFLIVLSATVSS